MPTIHLRHVTKSYDLAHGGHPSGAAHIAAAATQGFRASDTNRYVQHTRAEHEPADRVNAIDDLSLIIKDGETLSILGPSGCGKTTLLKIVAGLINPDNGDVLYNGRDIKGTSPADHGIGMVFQSYALYPHMSARDNIGFFDMIQKRPDRIPEHIRMIVNIMGVRLEHILSRKPPTLSGGEQQRVAVARCLARDPQVFLFDEPLSNLDAKLRAQTRVQIKRLISHFKITTIYVTHDQAEAISLADRIAVMNRGKIEQIGTYQTLYHTPRNAFIAKFLGSPPMNLFSGYVYGDTWENTSFKVSPVRPGLRNGQRVWVGIRPEHVEIATSGIAARIDSIEHLFTERQQLIYARIGSQPCTIRAPLTVAVERGDIIALAFPREHLAMFDYDTGVRIG